MQSTANELNLSDIKGVGPATIEKLSELGIFKPIDLLYFLPKSYIDLKLPVTILETVVGQFSVVYAEILNISEINFKHKRTFTIKAKSGKGVLKVLYFNQPYLKHNFEVGKSYLFLGKIQFDGAVRVLFNPICEKVQPKNTNEVELSNENKLQGIFTVYATKGVISQNTFKKIISNCIKIFQPQTLLSDKFCREQNITTLYDTFRAVHCPNNLDEVETAKDRLAVEDVVNNLIFYQKFKKALSKPRKVLYKTHNNIIVKCKNAIKSAFDFNLTKSQEEAVETIFCDLRQDKLMNRIIAGDVGSGKTIVAFCVVCFVALSNRQSVIMAPTEILARQHYENFLKFSKSLGISVCLITSSTPNDERKRILNGLMDGSIDLCIGTHSVLSEKIEFRNLSLVVFDEQQRFGVAQRQSLEQKGGETDILVLTATPIPRTMAMLLCGDLKVSTIYKRQDAISNIKTRIVTKENEQRMLSYVANECRQGKKALFVCPKLYDSEGLMIYSAEKLFKSLKTSEFSKIPLGLIHGKQTSVEKNSALLDLKEGRVSALVCTSVIEVGIDISDISCIVILNADRFGLSQLHQIRGRAGRNGDEAFCFLHTEREREKSVIARLNTLVNTMEGMEIATKDFELRGGGDFFGLSQSGESFDSSNQLKIDTNIITQSKKIADSLIYNLDMDDNDVKERLSNFDFSRYYDTIIGVTNN